MPDEAAAPAVVKPPQSRFIANVSLPQRFDTKGNLAANWKKWVQIGKAYKIVTGLDKQPSTLRVATFITCIGSDTLEIHTGLPFSSDAERENMDKVLELWQNYCIGRTNVIYKRYKFNNRSKEANESIDTYTTALRTLAETCEFGSLKDDLIRDCLVCGIRDNGQRKKLLQEPKSTLEKCLDSCRAAEATKLQVQDMSSQSKDQVKSMRSNQLVQSPVPVWSTTINFVESLTKETEKSVLLLVKSARSARKRIRSRASVTFMERRVTTRKRSLRLQKPAPRNAFGRK